MKREQKETEQAEAVHAHIEKKRRARMMERCEKRIYIYLLRCHFVLKMITLPRQARDKIGRALKKRYCLRFPPTRMNSMRSISNLGAAELEAQLDAAERCVAETNGRCFVMCDIFLTIVCQDMLGIEITTRKQTVRNNKQTKR